jgi:hypothetical protein
MNAVNMLGNSSSLNVEPTMSFAVNCIAEGIRKGTSYSCV